MKAESGNVNPNAPHCVVEARAGSGKTFTLVIGLAYMMGGKVWETACRKLGFITLEPSEQQSAVWKSLKQTGAVRNVCYLAFNRSIVDEFEESYSWLVDALEVEGVNLMFKTNHSLGNAACRAGGVRKRPNKWKTRNLIEECLDVDLREYMKTQSGRQTVEAAEQLTAKCKLNLIGWDGETIQDPTDKELDELATHYEIEVNGDRSTVYDLAREVLEESRTNPAEIDFDDMVWLPIVNGYKINRFDLVLGDEAQDWNRCQQEIILRAGERLVICGDPKQAIYGFAGADTESMNRMHGYLEATPRGVETLPLTVTRRCGKSIVAEASQIVPDFESHDSNPEGRIDKAEGPDIRKNNFADVQDGDMVLCRTNAPLVGWAFRMIRSGRKANIKGRDIGQGLIHKINKLKADDIPDLMQKVDDDCQKRIAKLQKRKHPQDDAIIAAEDKRDCILAFCEEAETIPDVIKSIRDLFDDNTRGGVLLSSVHRAKGMEADTVWILHPEKMPHPMAKTAWAMEQEQHLRYVAITRAINRLVYVNDPRD